jgi:Flp pilus assembly protein TadD
MGIVIQHAGEETDRSMAAQPPELPSDERLERAIAFKIEGNYQDAERELRAVLDDYPDHPAAHHQLGLVFNFTGMFDESIEELKRSVELDGTSLTARNDLGLAYTMLGMMDEAKQEFQTVLEMDPTNAVALRNMVYFE